MLRLILIWFATLSLALGGLGEIPHPRLWFPASAEAKVKNRIAADPLARDLNATAITEARRVLKTRTCEHRIPDGKRLLRESRKALHDILHCAWAWRMTGEDAFRLRAIAEMEAACGLPDWNTKHFLDTAEMAAAVAIGYDWLHPTLSPEQRAMCETAIIEKALKPAKGTYDKGDWWTRPRNNWSQVCAAGIGLAAAAIAPNDRGLAENLVDRGIDLTERCAEFYQPEGMYPEGAGYWHYGTNYHVMMLAACPVLQKPVYDDPVMELAGDSIMHLTSPSRLPFNFADGNAGIQVPTAAQCWLARHFQNPTQTVNIRNLFKRALESDPKRIGANRFFPLSILWLPAAPAGDTPLVNAAVYQGEQAMAIFRTGWKPGDAWFAIKGGTPAANHGHMDVGSFCYDVRGSRWIHDMGSENYNLPGYFGGKRWTYYRLQNRAHNTLEIDGKLQNGKAKPCPLTASDLTGNPLTARFDLTGAYSGSAAKVVRSARFDSGSGSARIRDRINSPAGKIVWRAFTDATPEISGDTVTLRKGGDQITLRNLSKTGAWSIGAATPPQPEENQNKKFRVVTLTVPAAPEVTLEIEIRP